MNRAPHRIPLPGHWGSWRKGREFLTVAKPLVSGATKGHGGRAGCCWLAASSSLGHLGPRPSREAPWLCPASGLCEGAAGGAVAVGWLPSCHPGPRRHGGSRVPAAPEVLPDGGTPCKVRLRGLAVPSHAAVLGGKFPILPASQKSGEVSSLALLSQLTVFPSSACDPGVRGLVPVVWGETEGVQPSGPGCVEPAMELQPFSWPLSISLSHHLCWWVSCSAMCCPVPTQ